MWLLTSGLPTPTICSLTPRASCGFIASRAARQFNSPRTQSLAWTQSSRLTAAMWLMSACTIYVRPVSGKDEKQLTKDKDGNLLNGEVDWVYAEELSVRSNYFWSPDGANIVFLQMDE